MFLLEMMKLMKKISFIMVFFMKTSMLFSLVLFHQMLQNSFVQMNLRH